MDSRTLCVVVAALTITAPCAAQDLTGAWKVTWAQGIRVQRDGAVEVESWGDAVLDLRQDGDLVTGTWIRPLGELGVARWRVDGSFRDGVLRLVARDAEADSDVVRAQLAQVDRLEWEGRLEGDRLGGEMHVVLRDAPRLNAARPWRGER